MQVAFTPSAERQIDSLHEFITKKTSEAVADGYVARLVSYCETLELFPERGTRRDDILAGLRTIGFERRVTIALVIMGSTVLIEGVFYGGQDYERHLGRRRR